jgi:hypothetical protein
MGRRHPTVVALVVGEMSGEETPRPAVLAFREKRTSGASDERRSQSRDGAKHLDLDESAELPRTRSQVCFEPG